MRLLRFLEFLQSEENPEVKNEVFVLTRNDESNLQILNEGKWIDKPFERAIRCDLPHVPGQQKHFHLMARKGGEFGALNIDGTASHGSKFVIPKIYVKPLDELGVKIPNNRVVEFWEIEAEAKTFLRESLGG